MYILDSDTVSLYLHHQAQQLHLVRRIQSTSPDLMWVSIITINETLNGAFRLINDSRRNDSQKVDDCRLLHKIMRGLAAFQILPMSNQAKTIFNQMPAATKRIGANDCKIAAIAHERGYTIITRNTEHFRQIGVPYEDWTIAER